MPASSIYLPDAVSWKKIHFFTNLRSLGRRLSRLRIFQPLGSLARSILYTAEPTSHLWIDNVPAIKTHMNCENITIISANLWHDFPHYRRIKQRLEAFIQLVTEENADILLLQEVARTPYLQVNEWLSQRLNMAYVYARANGHQRAIGFEEGLAIFSRYPLHTPSLRQLGESRNPFIHRLVLGASVETPCGELQTFSTHLSIVPRQNAIQINQLQDWVKEVTGDRTAVIGGDFNTHETRPQIKQIKSGWVDTFRQVNPYCEGNTHELRGPFGKSWRSQRLDYIFLQPGNHLWQVGETDHLQDPQTPHSDHQAVMVRLLPGSTPPL